MMGKNINQIATAALSVLAQDKFYLGRFPYGLTDDRYLLGSDLFEQIQAPWVYVGTAPNCQYLSIPDAVADGKLRLYVITDIDVLVDCTFSGFLDIRVAGGVTITWTNASIIGATGVNAAITFSYDGVCTWQFNNFTADRTVINLDNILPSPPSGVRGAWFLVNNSNPAFNIKPVSNRIGSDHLFYIENIVYIPPLNTGSYFDMEVFQADSFVAVGQQTSGQTALKVASGGSILTLYLAGDFNSSDYVVEGNNALNIDNCINKTPSSSTKIYLKNSSISGISGISDLGLHLESAGHQASSVINSYAFNFFATGTNAFVSAINCSIAGFNDSGLLSGKATISNCYFPIFPTFSAVNGSVDYSISNSQAVAGFQSTLSFMKFSNCTAGDLANPGTSATFIIGASSDSVQIVNCIADDTIIDNGTSSAYSYKIF
jgi:hypothetical protein